MASSDIQERILEELKTVCSLDTLQFANIINVDHDKVVGVVKSLQTFDDLVAVEKKVSTFWTLTEEGKMVVKDGSHEMQIYKQVPPEGILHTRLMHIFPDKKFCTVGFNKAMSAGWLTVDKGQKDPLVKQKCKPDGDVVQEHLQCILNENPEGVSASQKQDYKKRKLVQDVVVTSYILSKGNNFTVKPQKEANDLTVDMLTSGSWKKLEFKPYNLNALGTLPPSGHLHPLLKMRAEIRQIFLEMGFQEMPTNNYVESSFWNFDALFQPQQHPARDAHDTFFISEPAVSRNFPRDYLERVKTVHSIGGYGSQGYRYDWKEEEASKNLLRTHTTAVSARMLYKLAQEGFHSAKYFSIDRVFRNETLDATHLAEFQQVEGVVADHNLSLGNLIGILSEFFRKLGMEKLCFKPAYNPYTEPSMEIFCYHAGLGKMIEVGNSGMFRPEMLRPMGLPEDVNVIAWGLSLERPTMIKYGYNNIRDLVGPKVDLKMVYDNPICRLDKGETALNDVVEAMEQRWELIVSQLESLSAEVKALKAQEYQNDGTDEVQDQVATISQFPVQHERTEAVVFAKHSPPPLSALFMAKQLSTVCKVAISVHVHSSVHHVPSKELLNLKLPEQNTDGVTYAVTFIWKEDTVNSLVVTPLNHLKISGEVNILRYFSREYEKWPNSVSIYEKRGPVESSLIDEWLDQIHFVLTKPTKRLILDLTRNLEQNFRHRRWLVGCSPSVADMALWSCVKQCPELSASPHIKTWCKDFYPERLFVSDNMAKL